MATAPRPSLSPRQPRVLHAGPRVRLLETMCVLHVVGVFLCAFLAWMLAGRGRPGVAALLAAGAAGIAAMDLLRLQKLRRLRRLAEEGLITQGQVISARVARWPRAPRADRVLPRGGLPFTTGLEVTYTFRDDEGDTHEGRFLTTRRDRPLYRPGHPIEVFYLAGQPEANATSLLLRWYWRFGGAERSDEGPRDEFDGPFF